jgi:hypothetical protein
MTSPLYNEILDTLEHAGKNNNHTNHVGNQVVNGVDHIKHDDNQFMIY